MIQLRLPGFEPRKVGMRRPYIRGWNDYFSGDRWSGNPYTIGTKSFLSWARGWKDASRAHAAGVINRARANNWNYKETR